MRKKITVLFLTLICTAALAAGLAACSGSDLDDLIAEGYTIQITYDANGGYFGEPSQTLRMDFYNPDTLTYDEDGVARFQLQDFGDRTGVTGMANVTNPQRDSYGFWGWYETREIYDDGTGEIRDYKGNVLLAEEDDFGDVTYYYLNDKGEKVESEPIYTYSDEWKFSSSVIEYDRNEYAEGEIFEKTLYAAWVPYFEFDFYYLNAKGQYELYGTSSFNYASWYQNGTMANCLLIPDFPDEGGGMAYTQAYSDGSGSFTFPKLSGYTFSRAYYDKEGVQTLIDVPLEHKGELTDGIVAIGHVMNIYVEFTEGEIYHIMTAEQFVEYADTDSYLVIYNDLYFDETDWTLILDTGTFTGKIWTSDGEKRTFYNITVTHRTSGATYGGLFGCIGAKAEISNIEFCNVTYDLYSMSQNLSRAFIGLFAGDIEKGATLKNVSLSGDLKFKIGAVSAASSGNWINVLSNADLESFGVDLNGITSVTVSCYSSETWTEVDGRMTYRYNIAVQGYYPDSSGANLAVSVDENLDITFGRYSSPQNYYYTDEEQTIREYYFEKEYVVYSYTPSSAGGQNT